ncbi:MAG: hemolysin family protein [Candidatus Omnitrophica bacterium]|nr:hemolysin family protein [Candidatus Omnitrophota bacterium]
MLILFFLFLLCFSFFFSGSETAFLSLGKIRLKQIEGMHEPSAQRVVTLLRDPHKLLITIVVGNTLVNIAASSIMSEIFFVNFGEKGIGYSILANTAIILIFGEVTPKVFALANAVNFTLLASLPIKVLEWIFNPVRKFLTATAYGIVRGFGVNVSPERPKITQQEIRSLFSLGRKRGIVKAKERDMIENILEFKDLNAADIMTPRIDMVALDINSDREDLVRKVKEAQFSRLPAFVHSIDNIVGVVYAKEFLMHADVHIKDFVRRAYFVPETKRIDDLLEEMQHRRVHLAIVTDEYGVTSGIVTIEDLLEEIVGEISDELDHESPKVRKIDHKTFEVDGKAHIDEVNDALGLSIETDEVDTIGGYVILLMGKIPRAGDSVEISEHIFRVKDVSKNRVTVLEIEKMS